LAWRRTWTTVDLPPSMASRGAGKTGCAGGGGGGCGSLGGLPRRCHVPQCMPTLMPTLHEGQGEGKDGDGRTPLITSASSNKHLPMSRAQTKAPFGFSANRSTYLGRRKMQSLATTTSCFSICIRSPLVPCTFSVNSHGPIILFTAVVDRGRQAHSSEV
jgi:hypothetical protein